jgi:hypothetical protein
MLRFGLSERGMITIEERVRTGVEANWEEKQALIDWIVRELELLRSVQPTPAYLESIASLLEVASFRDIDVPEGATFDGPIFLRRAVLRVRLY